MPDLALRLLTARRADAHEGPVYVPHHDRLYFATKPELPAEHARVRIDYWDLAEDRIGTWLDDARMANGMAPSCDLSCLLVCEQGDRERPSALARYDLATGERREIVSDYRGRPFNSINKAVELPGGGGYIFSDPDYGRRQRFRPTRLPAKRVAGEDGEFLSPEEMRERGRPPGAMPPRVYLHRGGGETAVLDCALEQPHGLALSPDARHLYVSDTSADDGVGGFDGSRRHDVYRYRLDADAGALRDRTHVARVPEGVPDGMACDATGRLYCATGDGVRVYDPEGGLLHHARIEEGAVNLFLDAERARLFATTDERIVVYAVES